MSGYNVGITVSRRLLSLDLAVGARGEDAIKAVGYLLGLVGAVEFGVVHGGDEHVLGGAGDGEAGFDGFRIVYVVEFDFAVVRAALADRIAAGGDVASRGFRGDLDRLDVPDVDDRNVCDEGLRRKREGERERELASKTIATTTTTHSMISERTCSPLYMVK